MATQNVFAAMDNLNENRLPRHACCMLGSLSVQYGEVVEWEPQEIRDRCGVNVGSRYKARKINLWETWCDLLSLTSLCFGWRDVRVCIVVRMCKYELCIKLIYQSPILVLVFWACNFLIQNISRRLINTQDPLLWNQRFTTVTSNHHNFTLSWLQFVRRAVALLIEALCYKPEGCRFDSRWGHWNFQLT
jgi:hypothetical protein